VARISQTVSPEAYAIYDCFADKKAGLTAALLAFEYLEIPNDVFRALIEGDFDNLRLSRTQRSGALHTKPQKKPAKRQKAAGEIIEHRSSRTPPTVMTNDEEVLVVFDPFEPF
jgi:hypothetical protein